MVDRTYKEALADNELVSSSPGLNQELISGAEVFGATSGTDLDSGLKFNSFRDWSIETYPLGVMLKTVYDTGNSGRVDAAETISDGINTKSAIQVSDHIDTPGIHRELNDLITTATNLWSADKINTELSGKVDTATYNGHVNSFSNPHQVTHAQLPDGGANAHSVIDTHLAITSGNPHGVTHAILPDVGVNTHAQIDSHISSSGNPHGVTHAQVSIGDVYNHSQIDAHIGSTSNPHGVTAAQVGAAPDTHPGDTSHLTVAERQAMDNVSQALNAGNPFATMADIPAGSGHVIQDEGVDLAQRPNLNFVGPTVTVTDDPSAPTGSATKVEIAASGNVVGPGGGSVDNNLAAFDGINGLLLKDAGYAMPAGGAIGQVLGKASAADYDWAWINQTGGGGIGEAPNDAYGYLRRGNTSNDWVRGARVFEQATAPSAPSIGDVWIDTT